MNYKAVCRTAPATPGLLITFPHKETNFSNLDSAGEAHTIEEQM